MKYRIGFKLNWLEVLMVLVSFFFGGILIVSDIDSNYVISGLVILGGLILLNSKKVKLPKY
jgi:hypothetical protein